jgi:hypothetical protein
MNDAKTSFSTEIFSGAMISMVHYLEQLRYIAVNDTCNKAASHVEHHAVQVCGIFGVMMVPYFSAVVWGYQCQPFWQVAVPVVYYATAAIAAFSSTFAYSRMARCGTSVHCECLP